MRKHSSVRLWAGALCGVAFVMGSVLTSCVFAQASPSPLGNSDDPAAQLTLGVDAIASAGIPGPLAAFSDNAFPIVAGRQSDGTFLPVVVGATWQRGRVVAFGHGGMIAGDALKNEGTTKLLANAVRWLTSNAHHPAIGVHNNDAMVKALVTAGFNASAMNPKWADSLDQYSAIVIDSHDLNDAARDKITAYITEGGALLTAGLGWGWLQLHPGQSIHDHPGNRLLSSAGIVWCDGTLEAGVTKAFALAPLSASLHAAQALQHLRDALTGGGKLDAQDSSTLIAAVRAVPADHPLLAAMRAIAALHGADPLLSFERPLSRDDSVARVLVAIQIEIERRARPEEIAAHPASKAFPGEVPADAPRVERIVTVDLSIPAWHSTGLYAAPGEVITIEADEHCKGCSVRVGCHTDELWHHAKWKRVPDIAREWPVNPGVTRVASLFGGLVYIDAPAKTNSTASPTARFTIKGAVESPRYVLGKTSDDEWLESRSAPGPWGEVESGKVIVSVPSSSLRSLADPAALMRFWDQISDAHATLATIQLEPRRPHRFVADVQISAGYMHSGYPIMTHLDAAADMTTLHKLRLGSWGLLHELGHNHQVGDWTFEGTGEVTCNLFALHAIDTICSAPPGHRGHPGVDTPPSFKEYLAGRAPFETWKRDPFLALHMYAQLQKAFGWETFKRVFAEYRSLDKDQRPKNDDQKRDQWMVRFSRQCGRNLGPFFLAWGVPTSDDARDSIRDLPPWMPQGWPSN